MRITPIVSIILPTHNGAAFIRRAIESVRAQTCKEWELLVINDGSTDATGSLVTEVASIEPRIKILRFEKNKGIQKALNEGMLQARGEYIARIDDDDVWSDNRKLEKQLAFMSANPACLLVGTGVIVQDEKGVELYRFRNPLTDSAIRCRLLFKNCFSHSTVLFRRAAAMRFHGYDESEAALHVEDYDLWLKLGTIGQLSNLPDYAVRFTQRKQAISGRHKGIQLAKQRLVTARFAAAYPGARLAHLASVARSLGYRAFSLLPSSIQQRLLSAYKRL